jgi:hypothetical protein
MEASGARRGRGPRADDIHASQKALGESPAWRLIAALSSFVSADANMDSSESISSPDAKRASRQSLYRFARMSA